MDPNSIQHLAGMAYVQNLDGQLHEWEYEEPEPIIQLDGAVRLAGQVLFTLGNGLTWFGGRLKQAQALPLEPTLRRYENGDASR